MESIYGLNHTLGMSNINNTIAMQNRNISIANQNTRDSYINAVATQKKQNQILKVILLNLI